MHELDTDDLSGEAQYELEAAFGRDAVENGNVIELDTDDLDPVDPDEPPASFAEVDDVDSDHKVTEGDEVTVRLMSGDVWSGVCTKTTDESYMHRFRLEGDDPRGEYDTIPKSFQYEDFVVTERGITHELVSIN